MLDRVPVAAHFTDVDLTACSFSRRYRILPTGHVLLARWSWRHAFPSTRWPVSAAIRSGCGLPSGKPITSTFNKKGINPAPRVCWRVLASTVERLSRLVHEVLALYAWLPLFSFQSHFTLGESGCAGLGDEAAVRCRVRCGAAAVLAQCYQLPLLSQPRRMTVLSVFQPAVYRDPQRADLSVVGIGSHLLGSRQRAACASSRTRSEWW